MLTLLWALPDTVLTDFYHHFYATLHTGNKVAAAVREAVNVIKKDERLVQYMQNNYDYD